MAKFQQGPDHMKQEVDILGREIYDIYRKTWCLNTNFIDDQPNEKKKRIADLLKRIAEILRRLAEILDLAADARMKNIVSNLITKGEDIKHILKKEHDIK